MTVKATLENSFSSFSNVNQSERQSTPLISNEVSTIKSITSTDHQTTSSLNNYDLKDCKLNPNYLMRVGLKHYWNFDGNLNDSVGNAHLFGGINRNFTFNRFNISNSAINLTNGYLDMPPGVYLNSSFTLSAWIYPTKFVNWARVVEFANGAGVDTLLFAYSNQYSGKPTFDLYGSTTYRVTSSLQLKLNDWHHLAFSINESIAYIYINGTQTGVNPSFILPLNKFRTKCYVGRSNWGSDGLAYANLDEIKIFNRALSQQEIINEMNNDLCL